MSSQTNESTGAIEFLAWLETNKKKVIIGVGVLAAAIAVLSIYRWRNAEAETEAAAALFKAKPPLSQDTDPASAQALLQVATTYSGTSAGSCALLLGADFSFRENKYADAKTEFENYLRDHADSALAATAALGVAASLDALNRTNEALTAYQDVLNRYAGSPVTGQVKLALARLYETKGEPVQALKIYEELARPTANSSWSSEAAMHREQLLSQHPELAPTNTPVATASQPASKLLPLAGTNAIIPAKDATSK